MRDRQPQHLEQAMTRGARVARPDSHPGQVGRFGNITRMVIHPDASDPTAPNTGTITYPPGTGFPAHGHGFAQVWYILEGECRYGEQTLRAGDLVYHGDPHEEKDMHTEHGCTMLFVQYPGPTTGERPIFDGRFDARAATQDADMDLDR
ncbi:MAG: cupin domain-containing protein [Gammaproteobacteria bacterium]|nr:cupin domain-containing protein [Gammaproteobacteria bacterium]